MATVGLYNVCFVPLVVRTWLAECYLLSTGTCSSRLSDVLFVRHVVSSTARPAVSCSSGLLSSFPRAIKIF